MKRTRKVVKQTGNNITGTCDALHTIRDGGVFKFLIHYEYDHNIDNCYCKIISLIDDIIIADGIYFHMESLEDIILYHIDEIKSKRLGITVEEYQNRHYQQSVTNGIPDDELPF